MNKGSEPIRVNTSIGKRPKVGPVPGDFAFTWGVILVGSYLFYLLLNQFFTFSIEWAILLAAALIISHWILYGDKPWKYGGKFHQPATWTRGHPQLQPHRDVLKPKVGKKVVGTGKNKRALSPIEDEFHLVCLTRIQLKGQSVGAYLLQKGTQFRLVWAFDCLGISSTLSSEEVDEIVERLRSGFKGLPAREQLTIHMGTFASDADRQAQLKHLTGIAPIDELKFLLKALRARIQKLTRRGSHNPKFLRLYMTYTIESGVEKAEGWVEKLLAEGELLWDTYRGVSAQKERYRLEKLLFKAFDDGFLPTQQFLATKLGLKVRPLPETEIWATDWKRFNSSPPPAIPQLLILDEAGLQWEINSQTHITTSLLSAGSPIADKRWVYLPGIQSYVGGAVYEGAAHENKPGGWPNLTAQLFSGSDVLNRSDVADTEIFVQLTCANQTLVVAATQELTKQSNLSATLAQDKKRIDVGASYNTRKNIEAQEALLDGEFAINVAWVALVYRPTPEALSKALQRFVSLFRRPAVVVREQEYFDTIWLETLPFVWRLMLDKPYNRRKVYLTRELIGLLPLVFDRTLDTSGVGFISEKGATPLFSDLFDRHQHIAILGTTGSGKSVLSAEYVTFALAHGFDVIIVDSTRGDGSGTFDAYTDFLGGAYYNTIKESNNLFETPDLRGLPEEEREEKFGLFKDLLRSGLMMLVLDKDADRSVVRTFRSILNLTLSAFFKDPEISQRYNAAHDGGFGSPAWSQMPTLRDYLHFVAPDYLNFTITPEIKRAIQTIRMELESCLESQLGRAISSPSTFRTDAKLVVYALGNLDDEQDAAPLALSAYAAALRRSLTSPKSLWFIDESSFLLGFDSFAEIVGAIFAKGRKAGIRAMFSAQDISSIKNCKTSKQILDNTSTYLIGRIKSSAIDDFESALKIPRAVIRKNTVDSFASHESEFATPWLLARGDSYIFGKYYPSLEQLALLVNNPDQVAMREKFWSQYPNKYQATVEFAKYLASAKLDNSSQQNAVSFSHQAS